MTIQNNIASFKQNVNNDGFAPYRCEVCECPFFQKTHTFFKRSKIVSPTGQDEFKPNVVFRCENCGWVVGAPYDENIKKEIQKKMKTMSELMSKKSDNNVEIIEEKMKLNE